MDKGIRVNARNKFIEMMPQRAAMGNTPFRKGIIAYLMEEFKITLSSAATHYNDAFKEARKVPELAAQLLDLGRPADKKGGRKPKAKVEEVAGTTVPEQTEFTVKKKSDGSIVAEKLSFEAAQELIAKAKSAKKAALYWV